MSRRINTDKEELLVYEMVKSKYNGLISRYVLEGIILYEYNQSAARLYNIIMNLTLKDMLELISKSDGEYYKIKVKK